MGAFSLKFSIVRSGETTNRIKKVRGVPKRDGPPLSLGTNLIHDFTAVTFSVKLAFFREKRPFPCFREIRDFFINFNAFIFIYEGCQSFINSLCADFAVATCHTSALSVDRFLSLY